MLFNIIITSTLNNWKLQHIYFRSFFQEPDFFWTKLVNYRHLARLRTFRVYYEFWLLLFFWSRIFGLPENHDLHRPLEAQEYFTIWENYTLYCPCCHYRATMTTTLCNQVPLQLQGPQGYHYYYKATRSRAALQVPTACYNRTRVLDDYG